MAYDVICESATPRMPPDAPFGDIVRSNIPTYDEAQRVADSLVAQFGELPGARVTIWDSTAQRTIVVHEPDE